MCRFNLGYPKIFNSRVYEKFIFGILCLFIIVSSGIFAVMRAEGASNSQHKNYLLVQKIVSLEEDNFRKLYFAVEINQRPLPGGQPKFILVDTLGNQWLFKEEAAGVCAKFLAIYTFAKMSGVKLPEIHCIDLKVNNRLLHGTLERFLSETVDFKKISLEGLDPHALADLQRQHVFDWCIFNFDNNPYNFLMDIRTDTIVGVDKDRAFERDTYTMPLSDDYYYDGERNSIYCLLWDAVKCKKVTIDFSSPFPLIYYISAIDDTILSDIFSPILSDPSLIFQGNIGPILERKKTLVNDYTNFYWSIAHKSNRLFNLDRKNISSLQWGRNVYIQLKKEYINLLKISSSKINKEAHFNKQEQLEVIFSPEAWRIVRRYLLRYDKLPKTIQSLQLLYEKIENKYEKIATKLYLQRMLMLESVPNADKWFWGESIILHPSLYANVDREIQQLALLLLTPQTNKNDSKMLAETGFFPKSRLFIAFGNNVASECRGIPVFDRFKLLSLVGAEWKRYALEGFLLSLINTREMDDEAIKKMISSVTDYEKQIISIYAGRNLYSSYKPQMDFFRKRCRELGLNWEFMCSGIGIQGGFDFINNPDKFYQVEEELGNVAIRRFYPGFGYGFGLRHSTEFKGAIQRVPPRLTLYCYEGIGNNAVTLFDCDMKKLNEWVAKAKFLRYENNFIFRGIGQGIAYWYFNQIGQGAELIKLIDGKDYQFQTYYGMQFYVFHNRRLWEGYDPREMMAIAGLHSSMERH